MYASPQIHNEGFRSFCIWFGRIEYRTDEAMSKEIDQESPTSKSTMEEGGASRREAKDGASGSKIMESGRKKLSYASYLWMNKKVLCEHRSR